MTKPFNLQDDGITVTEIHRNLPPSALYEHAIRYEKDASIAENGALVSYSGAKTGRSPKDKRLVKTSRLRSRCMVGQGQSADRDRSPSPSTASAPATISIFATGSTASMGSPAGIIRSRYA